MRKEAFLDTPSMRFWHRWKVSPASTTLVDHRLATSAHPDEVKSLRR
jgi:hypothetical protein